ncbi:MAG: extracellular solute-binding protein [Lachnospiraceae bacterium]|nr:extracellular solute-binding protein [Lachnospiraceae bacterium]
MRAKTWITILAVSVIFGVLCYVFWPEKDGEEKGTGKQTDRTLILWYTDESLTDYLNSACIAFQDENGVRVEPVLKTGLEYIEEIYQASLSGEGMPDLYITGSDTLEKAALAGLAVPIEDPEHVVNSFNFPPIAFQAVTYQGKQIAYPFYYETAFLLYNQTYLSQMADAELRSNPDEELDEEGEGRVYVPNAGIPEGYTEETWAEAVDKRTQELIPSTIEEIRQLAATHGAPEGMENFFLWDVSDIFYNYFFTGAYMNVGGECGDDPTQLDICNEDTIRCMTTYQGLHEYFSIESKESSYEKVVQDFLDGKSLFTIVTTDGLAMVEKACHDEEFHYGYGVAPLPGLDDEHGARGLSTTSCVVVNGYSAYPSEANLFAEYVMYEDADSLYDRTGKMPCVGGAQDESVGAHTVVRRIYMESASLPKLITLSNFWLELELVYTRIWDGADPEETLRSFSEQMEEQMKKQL